VAGPDRVAWRADPGQCAAPRGELVPGHGKVLASTRVTCAFAALGHAVGAYDAALTHCRERRQFGKPLISFQIVQERLVKMLADVTAMQLFCLRVGRLGDNHQLKDTIAGLAKMNNTSRARHVIAQARDLFGGDGISPGESRDPAHGRHRGDPHV
jgi:glutaryl-CoA dehydrogenase